MHRVGVRHPSQDGRSGGAHVEADEHGTDLALVFGEEVAESLGHCAHHGVDLGAVQLAVEPQPSQRGPLRQAAGPYHERHGLSIGDRHVRPQPRDGRRPPVEVVSALADESDQCLDQPGLESIAGGDEPDDQVPIGRRFGGFDGGEELIGHAGSVANTRSG